MMYRTQVYFPKEILEELRREAFESRKSLAYIIRGRVTRSMRNKDIKKTSKEEIKKRFKLLNEISKLNLPTMNPKQMKKILSEAHEPHV